MLIKISDTVMVNPAMVSGVEIVTTSKGRRLFVYVDGKSFNCTVPFEEVMIKLMGADETKQMWAG
jgi:hypothetical protein